MEFSFDRPQNSGAKQSSDNTQSAPSNNANPDSVDTSTIANERLRKAIERNRAKQTNREAQSPPQSPFQTKVAEAAAEQHQQPSFFEKQQQQRSEAESNHEAREEIVRETRRELPRSVREMPRTTSVVSRRSVAKPEDTEFVPVKRTTKKMASQISYTTTSSRKKSKPLDPKLANYLVKGCWIFCAVMVLRLIFANGGITDYYSQKEQVNERVKQLNDIKTENMQLVREIERMRNDYGFQKKLVRDNLGFIAQDEFLILFPKEN